MANVVKHGWTHRPRAQGGTDPIDTGCPSAYTGPNGGFLQTSSDARYFVPSADTNFFTTDESVFRNDPSERAIQIMVPGMFLVHGIVTVASGDAAKPRFVGLEFTPEPNWPPSTGEGIIPIFTHFDSDINPTSGTGRRSIHVNYFGPMGVESSGPTMVALVSTRISVDFELSGYDDTGLTICRLGDIPSVWGGS